VTVFTVHIPPHAVGQEQDQHVDTVFIPDASSLMALIFPFVWLIWHRLWWAFLFYVLLMVALFVLMIGDFSLLASAITFIPGLFLYLEGQELRRKKLARQGWKMMGTVEGQDMASAEYRYFHEALENQKKQSFAKQTKPLSVKPFSSQDTEIEFPGGLGIG
jgi:hypothetical protein